LCRLHIWNRRNNALSCDSMRNCRCALPSNDVAVSTVSGTPPDAAQLEHWRQFLYRRITLNVVHDWMSCTLQVLQYETSVVWMIRRWSLFLNLCTACNVKMFRAW
jgi:hypothetical protein